MNLFIPYHLKQRESHLVKGQVRYVFKIEEFLEIPVNAFHQKKVSQ